VILIGFSASLLIFFILDKILKNSSFKRRTLIFLVGSLIVVDQYRSPYKGWDSDSLVNLELMKQKQDIVANCDYFYYDFPGGWWNEQIEAMMF
jgi:hypothetical protein